MESEAVNFALGLILSLAFLLLGIILVNIHRMFKDG